MLQRTIIFSINVDDLTAASRSHYRVANFSKRAIGGYCFIWAVLSLNVGIFETGEKASTILRALGVTGLAWFGLVAFLMAIGWASVPQLSQRNFDQQKLLREEYQVGWTETDVDIRTPNSSTQLKWRDFIRWNESATTIMLYQADRMFNFIPKWAFGEGMLDDFRAQLIATGVPKARFFG